MALDGASSGDASAPPPPPSPPPPPLTRERRERKPRATSWRTRRLFTTLWPGEWAKRSSSRMPSASRGPARDSAPPRFASLGRASLPLGSTEARRAHGQHFVLPKRRCARRPRRTRTAVCGAKHVLRTQFEQEIPTLFFFQSEHSVTVCLSPNPKSWSDSPDFPP